VLVSDPGVYSAVDRSICDHAYGEMAESRDDAAAPAGEVGVEGFRFESAERKGHDRFAVFGERHGGGGRADTVMSELLESVDPVLGSGLRGEGFGDRTSLPGAGVDPANPAAVLLGAVRPVLDVGAQSDFQWKEAIRCAATHAACSGSTRRLRSQVSTSLAL
jgi:hypothetical protein